MDIENSRDFWKIAGGFPAEKEGVYPDHARAHAFDEQARGKVLEYGCGGGSDTISLLRRGAEVFFVDIVPQNIALTRSRVEAFQLLHGSKKSAALGYVLSQSDELPFHDSCFDSINCHGVLHHIPVETMHRVIKDMFRVLRPGGHLYAMLYTEHLWKRCLPAMQSLQRAHGWDLDRCFGYMTDGGNDKSWCIARSYDEGQATGLFLDHGFEVVSHVVYNNGDFRTTCARRPL